MGVRPPAGDTGEWKAVEFGIAALDPMVEEADLEFPADADEIVRSLDDPDVPVDPQGRSITLSVAIEETGEVRFDSRRGLLNAVHPVLESHRELVSGGWLAAVRSRLPL